MAMETDGMSWKIWEGFRQVSFVARWCSKRRETASQLVSLNVAITMNQSDTVNDWPSDDASEAQISANSSKVVVFGSLSCVVRDVEAVISLLVRSKVLSVTKLY